MLAPRSPQIASVFRDLESEARAAFSAEGARAILSRSADLRYHGQGFELRVDWSANAVARFHRLHAQSYGYADPTRAIEIVTLRVQAIARSRKPRIIRATTLKPDARNAQISAHRIFEEGRWRTSALYDRALLHPGNRIKGPAVITELSATTYLSTGWTAAIDSLSNLVLTPRAGARR
jgi:N-methylhydantoinase A/oxoprolinase/acetone carboxylase beta subunit